MSSLKFESPFPPIVRVLRGDDIVAYITPTPGGPQFDFEESTWLGSDSVAEILAKAEEVQREWEQDQPTRFNLSPSAWDGTTVVIDSGPLKGRAIGEVVHGAEGGPHYAVTDASLAYNARDLAALADLLIEQGA